MVTVNTDLQRFLNYLKGVGNCYFGRSYLMPETLLLFYLEYDASKNFLRKNIIELLHESLRKSTNENCVKAINALPDEESVNLSRLDILGCNFKVSESLCSEIMICFDSTTKNDENITIGLDDFIYNVLFFDESIYYRIKKFIESAFNIDSDSLKHSYKSYLKDFKPSEDTKINIPSQLMGFVSEINGCPEEYNVCYKELDTCKEMLYALFQKRKLNNVILLGGLGVGKKPAVNKIAYEIANGTCLDFYKDFHLIKIDLYQLLSKNYRFDEVDKLSLKLVEFLDSQEKIIVFIDNFYLLFENEDDRIIKMLNFNLFPIFVNDNYRIVTSLLTEQLEFMDSHPKLMKRFINLSCTSPTTEELKPSLKATIKALTYYHGVYISDEMINLTILYTDTFRGSTSFLNIKDSLDIEMANARNNGRCSVTSDDIKFMYRPQINEYAKYTNEFKLTTAIHEAGHFVITRFCEHYKTHKVKLISIIPTDDAAGFNLLEFDHTQLKDDGYDFYLEMIASLLGGRAAEELFIGQISAGAASDLEVASEVAKAMISDLSLDRRNGKEQIQVNESLNSERSVNRVDRRANKIIKTAYKLAKNILSENADYLTGLSNLLLKEQIVSSSDIEKHEREYNGRIFWNED